MPGQEFDPNQAKRRTPEDHEFDTILLTANSLRREQERTERPAQELGSPNINGVEQPIEQKNPGDYDPIKGFGTGPHDRSVDWNHS